MLLLHPYRYLRRHGVLIRLELHEEARERGIDALLVVAHQIHDVAVASHALIIAMLPHAAAPNFAPNADDPRR
jgi:hypothetical protein